MGSLQLVDIGLGRGRLAGMAAKISERYCVPPSGPWRFHLGRIMRHREINAQQLAECHQTRVKADLNRFGMTVVPVLTTHSVPYPGSPE